MSASPTTASPLGVEALLAALQRAGVRLQVREGQLAVSAPRGSLGAELRDALTRHKAALVALLERAGADDALPLAVPDPAARHEPFPLTDVQHAYWMGRNAFLELGGVSTHFYFELDTGLELGRLEEALQRVIARHDMLRAVIDADGRQRVLPEVPYYAIRVVHAHGEAEAAAAVAEARKAMSHQVLSTERWPVFEIRATVGPAGVRLHVSLDLLMIDGASLFHLLREWRRCYDEPQWRPAPPALGFRDYVLAERASMRGPAWERARRYWLDRLPTLPPRPRLPVLPADADLPPRFTRRRARIEPAAWRVLKGRAAEAGITPSVMLMAAFSDLLRVWSKESDFTLNLTLFNRLPLHPEVDSLLGDFTSVTLLAARAQVGEGFVERAQRLQRQLSADLDHARFSGVQVLRERVRRYGGALSAAMPVVFTSAMGYEGAESGELTGAIGHLAYGTSQTPQVWLDHQVMEELGGAVYNWDAVEALFPPGVLDDMFAAYGALLDRLATDAPAWRRPGTPACPPPWQQREREAANATAADIAPRTLHGLVRAQSLRTPHATAVIAHDGVLSHGELMAHAWRLAQRLGQLGAGAGTRVAISMDKGWEQVAAVLGVLHAGAAYLPIDPALPAQRRALLLAQAQTSIVVTQAHLAGLEWPTLTVCVTLADPEVVAAPAVDPGVPERPGDLAYVIFTSGSTGVPKGVAMAHGAAANTVQDINRRFGVGPADRVLALSSLAFDLSVYDVFGLLAAGGAVVLPDPARAQDPLHWAELVQRHRVTLWNTVPQLMQLFVEALREPPAHVPRLALLSGDWIPVHLPDAARRRMPGLAVVSLGGATEAAIWSVAYEIGAVDPAWPSIPYGRPLANQQLHVLNDLLEPCAVWAVGALFVGGAGLAQGYWGDHALTAERFITHPRTGERLYRTGDLGRYLPGGDIEFLGREDHQVKVNGYRIEPGEIVAHLRRLPGVQDALVKVVPGASGGAGVLAAYVVTPGPADASAWRTALQASLPDHMVPLHYVAVPAFPLTPTGKVDHRALPPAWGAGAADAIAPRDALERRLHALWCDTLACDDFGVEDSFFDLGGDSLSAMRIVTQVQQTHAMQPEAARGLLRHFFENPTVAALAAYVREGEMDPADAVETP